MRALVQRVSEAAVSVDGREVARIGPGMLVLLGVGRGDGPEQADRVARGGVFGARMVVSLENDGPVTLLVEA